MSKNLFILELTLNFALFASMSQKIVYIFFVYLLFKQLNLQKTRNSGNKNEKIKITSAGNR